MGLLYSQPVCQSAYDGDVKRLHRLLIGDPTHLNIQEDDSGDTPLIAACRHGNRTAVRYLLDIGADVHLTNKKNRTGLHYVARRTFSVLDYLMMAVLMPVLLLGYFLMLQKQRQHVALMQEVLRSNVNVDVVDYKGNTALHYVCERKSVRLVPLLLEKHCDTNIRNNDGETPLDIATRLKFNKIVQMLKKTR